MSGRRATDAERVPPHDIEAERALLGAILVNNGVLSDIRKVLRSDDFYRESHRTIVRAMDRLFRNELAIDIITLKSELTKSGDLEDVGGALYLSELMDGVPKSINAAHYASLIRQHASRRALITAATATIARAFDGTESPEDIRASTVQTLSALVVSGTPNRARNFEAIGDQRYRMKVEGLGIVFDVDRLHRERGDLIGELQVTVNGSFPQAKTVEGVLSMANFNLSGERARTERANLLAKRSAAGELDWYGYLEEFCVKVLATERAGLPAVLLSEIDDNELTTDAPTWDVLGLPILRDLPMMFYGDGGTAKSYLALMVAKELQAQGVPVLYNDWEFAATEHKRRLKRLANPDPMPPVHYLRCERPMRDEAERIARLIRQHGIGYVINDSVAFACDGRPEEAEQAGLYFRALREFGIGSLNIAHVTKSSEPGQDNGPFGTVFWKNGVRSMWSIQRAEDNPPGELRIGLYHRKSNTSGLLAPRAYVLHFETHKTWFESTKVADVDELAAKLPLVDRMRKLLAKGALPPKEIAESLGTTAAVIRSTVARHGKTFIKVGAKVGLYQGSTEF